MSGSPRTWFSGKSSPEDHKGVDGTTMIAAAFMVLSPVGALTALAGYLTFTVGRYSWKVIGGATGIYAALFVLFGGLRGDVVGRYFSPWSEAWAAFGSGPGLAAVAGDRWGHWLLAQAPLSILLGGVFATGMTGYKWLRRAEWDVEANLRRPGPYEVYRLKKNVAAIANATVEPGDGHTIGTVPDGRLIVQTTAEGAAHTLIAGGSGSGKTTTMLSMIRDDIRKGEAVIFVDLKGATDVPAQLAEWADRYGRRFMHWTIQNPRAPYLGPADGPAFYDPIGRGDPSRRKDLLIGSQKWDVEYYKTVIANYLQTAFLLADRVPDPNADSFADLAALLDTKKLSLRAGYLLRNSPLTIEAQQALYGQPAEYRWWDWIGHVLDPEVASLLAAVDATVNGMEETERSGIRSMSARMQELTRSVAGHWLKKDPTGQRDIDLRKVADEGWVVVFTLDSANYAETASKIGGLVIQDIQTLSSELRHEPARTPTHLYIDEFSAVGSDNVLGLLARARDAKIPVTLSTQALADLKRADDDFLEQCMGIVNCFMVHRANQQHDAEILAGLTGKQTVLKKTYGIEMTSGAPGSVSSGAATGSGMLREEEEYTVLPSKIQDLPTGQLVYIANSPKRRVEYPVQVTPEDPMAVAAAGIVAQGRPDVPTEEQAAPVEFVDGMDAWAPAVPAPVVPAPRAAEVAPAPWAAASPSAPTGTPSKSGALAKVKAFDETGDPAAQGAAAGPAPVTTEPSGPVTVPVPTADVAAAAERGEDAPYVYVRREGPPLISPDAFRSRKHVPVGDDSDEQVATAPAPVPVPAPAPAPSPAPVATPPTSRPPEPSTPPAPPVTPELHAPRALTPLPMVRPTNLTAPWLQDGDVDELGHARTTPAVADDGDEITGSAFAFGATDTETGWGEAIPETGPVYLCQPDLAPAQPEPTASEPANLPTTPTDDRRPVFPPMTDTEHDWSTR
jgi:hypothetical protein